MSNNKPLISILMPVRNAEYFLTECVDSILKQSFPYWELVAVDDQSADKSHHILSEYRSRDDRIKVLKNKGDGIIDALRSAYHHARGQYISRMDADDVMASDKLELMYRQLKERGRGHLAVGLVQYFSQTELGDGYRKYAKWLNGLTIRDANFSDIYKECSIPSPCWMVHKTDLDRCGAFDSNVYPEDYDLAFRFKKCNLKISHVNKILHHWRDHKTRTSRTHEHYSDNRFTELKLRHFLEQDRNFDIPLLLWGAGQKGKQIASSLVKSKVLFIWLTNNTNKIGKDIYTKRLENYDSLARYDKGQVIVAVNSLKDQKDIELTISKNKNLEHFYFC